MPESHTENIVIKRVKNEIPSYKGNRLTAPVFAIPINEGTATSDFPVGRNLSSKMRSHSTTDLPKLLSLTTKAEDIVANKFYTGPVRKQKSFTPPIILGLDPVQEPSEFEEINVPLRNQFTFDSTNLQTNSEPGSEVSTPVTITNQNKTSRSSSTTGDSSDSGGDEKDKSIPICDKKCHEGKTIVDSIIECSVDELFTLLFTGSKFFMDFHELRKTTNMVQSAWRESNGKQTRNIKCTIKLTNKIGPAQAQLTEEQVMLPHSKKRLLYAIDMESNNAGIPYADTFYVTVHFCMSRLTSKTSRLLIIAQVKYRKSAPFAKPFIEKNAWTGLDEFYKSLVSSVQEEARKNKGFLASAQSLPSEINYTLSEQGGGPPRKRFKRPAPPPPTVQTNPNNNACKGSLLSKASRVTSDSTFLLRFIFVLLVALSLFHIYLFVKVIELETFASNTSNGNYCGQPQTPEKWIQQVLKQSKQHEIDLKDWYKTLGPTIKYLEGLDFLKPSLIDETN